MTGAGGTVGAGLEPQEALSATPRAAARISAIFIDIIWFLLLGFNKLI